VVWGGSRSDDLLKAEEVVAVPDSLGVAAATGSEERAFYFQAQTEILRVMTSRLVEDGFAWFLPVILAKSTDPLWPDPGASIEQRIEFKIYGETVKTMQSMIIHKRVLVSLGSEKFFILSPNIRIEKRERAKTGWHLYEFTQLEIEIAHGKMQDVFRAFETLITASITAVKDKLGDVQDFGERKLKTPNPPFQVLRRTDLTEKYGSRWEPALSSTLDDPAWVTDIPREFYDFQDEASGAWLNFDLILPEGYGEVISGAEREYEYEKMSRKLKRDGLKKEDYELLFSLAEKGKLKPSAGAGLGIERFIAYVCGAKHVAQVQPFPRIPGTVPEL
jgi:asparaginyl-tRNA synthetase